jgi:hypothetical protein
VIDLKQVHAVLCQPEDVRNVGAAIRAVANHGLASLRIVKTPVGQSLDGQSQDGQDGQSPGQSNGQSDGQRQDAQSQDGRFLGAEGPDDGPFSREDLFHYSAGASERIPVQVFSSLDAALQDCAQVVGTSRRTRDPLAPPFWPAAGLRRRLVEEGPRRHPVWHRAHRPRSQRSRPLPGPHHRAHHQRPRVPQPGPRGGHHRL